VKVYPKSLTRESFFSIVEGKSVVYILPRMSVLDILVLNLALKLLGQRRVSVEAKPKRFRYCALLALKTGALFFSNFYKDHFLGDFMRLMRNDPRSKSDKLIFMPVSVFWSRAPERNEKNFLLRSLFPDDGIANVFQKLFMLLLHRGEVNVSFGKFFYSPSVQFSKKEDAEFKNSFSKEDNSLNTDLDFQNACRMRRLFNIEFAKERTATFGPTLYDKEKICQWILSTPGTKKFIENSENPMKIERQIVNYIREIGANYNYVTIRALEKLFDFIWTKIFEGVCVRNFQSVERLAKDGQIIWMPSHRSHFDYLLLSYVLFKKGLVIPHIAAGINLNFWPIGSILRKGGAFFIRRSFSGNRVYAHTFSEYVNFLLQNSFPVEFFQEGGRSRIGKLLSPKLGLLNICVQSILQRKAENTHIVPVYFGYDKVMEDASYAKELKGAKKQKENAFQFLNGIRKVFSNYGKVYVSFGEPLKVSEIWKDYLLKIQEDFRIELPSRLSLPLSLMDFPENFDVRDFHIQGFVRYLAKRVNQKINGTATASATAVLASCLLANKTHVISRGNLCYQTLLLNDMINSFAKKIHWKLGTSLESEQTFEFLCEFNKLWTENSKEEFYENILQSPEMSSIANLVEQTFSLGERWGFISQKILDNGILGYEKNPDKEMNLWWYRGTVFHVLVPFGILASFLLKNKSVKKNSTALYSLYSSLRRLWQEELFWDSKTSSLSIAHAALDIFEKMGFIELKEVSHEEKKKMVMIEICEQPFVNPSLVFLEKTIFPEFDLYSLQLALALKQVKTKGVFGREELIQKTITTYSSVFLCGTAAKYQPFFLKVFAQRSFDAFSKAGYFIPREQHKFSLNAELLPELLPVLNISNWSQFVF
jgi:glycerol-3-phosphate O-acyltransferase